ncbi:DUF624 domain-containing protein [Bacillus shivajii]|uniref:YesL family protein n=1 Tax=Bacillus shivajii TaxID=1983719 RepID=UPI001CFC41BF|nr:DUF624 domain-containing protein [Bacillus shivajii]UCZ53903.1 DUF624 domain-containing protein [Bacillus shivajii]
MQLGGTSGVIYRVSDWLMKLAVVNVMWIAFTILGLGVFGFYPAFIAMTTIIIAWKNGENPPYIKTFFQTYKRVFLKANNVALGAILLTFLLFVNMSIIRYFEGFLFYFFFVSTIMLILVVWSSLVLVAIAYGREAETFHVKDHFQQMWMMMVMHPFKLVALILGIATVVVTILFFPAIAPFYSVSVLSWVGVSLFYSNAQEAD